MLQPEAQRREVPEAVELVSSRSRWERFGLVIEITGLVIIVPGVVFTSGDRRCFNCDKPGFTREHMNDRAARNVTCNFCRKVGHFERTCRAKENTKGNLSVAVIQEQANQDRFESEETEDEESQH